jgi:Zn-dependent protease with chaperone function
MKTKTAKKLAGLTPALLQHPSDRAILTKLEVVPVLPGMVGKILDTIKESLELNLLSNSLHVTAESLPKLHAVYRQTCDTLCIATPPPLYVEYSPGYNAYTMGVDKAFIVVHSSLVADFDDAELTYIIGHELGHYLSGHVKYQTLVRLIGGNALSQFSGLAKIAANATFGPLLYLWSRRAEYTGDRAGLLACQDVAVAHRANLKLVGCPRHFVDSLSPDVLLKQAEEFHERISNSVVSRVFSGMNQIFRDHPRIIERFSELKNWIEEGWFDDIVEGTEESRRKLASQLAADPQTAEMMLLIMQNIARCAAREFSVPRPEAARLLRRAVFCGETLKFTALERILRIELAIAKDGPDKVRYSACFLINQDGRPVAQRFALLMPESWDDAPAELRKTFIAQNTDTIVNVLYSV